MSVKVMGLVWDMDLPHAEKFVLLAMADHADHTGGNVYPSVPTIAKKTGYNDRTVRRAIASLVALGRLITVEERDGMATIYRIHCAKEPLSECHPCQNVTPVVFVTPTPDIYDRGTPDIYDRGLLSLDDSSSEPSVEPSDARGKKQRRKKLLPVADDPPTLDEVEAFCINQGWPGLGQAALDFQTLRGWQMRSGPVYDWKAAVRTWQRNEVKYAQQDGRAPRYSILPPSSGKSALAQASAEREARFDALRSEKEHGS